MVLKLYGTQVSPPVRATLLTIKALGLDVEWKEVDISAAEQFTEEFLELNPLHTVPVLQDDDFVIWDSHAINAYLVGKYGKNDALYPKDLQKRAVIDQRLHFDCGILFNLLRNMVYPVLRLGVKIISKENIAATVNGYESLERLLELSTYVAGEQLSIADFSVVTTITSIDIFVPIVPQRHPRITEWLKRMQALPYYKEANQVGIDKLSATVKSKLA